MTVTRKILLILAGLFLVLVAAVYWVVGSEAGTRFLLARAPLPVELELDDVGGSLLYGIRARQVRWTSPDVSAVLSDIEIDIAVRRLLARNVWIQSLAIGASDVRVQPTEKQEATGDFGGFDSPINITVESSTIRYIRVQVGDVRRELDELRMAGALRGSRLQDLVVAVRSSWLDADLAGEVGFSRNLPVDFGLDWMWTDEATGVLSGRLEVDGNRERYAVRHNLREPLALASSGDVSYVDDVVGLDLQNAWQSLEWPVGDRTLRSGAGSLRLFGSLDALSFALSTDAALDGTPVTTIKAAGSLDPSGAHLVELDVKNELGRLLATGPVAWSPLPEFDVAFEVADIDPSTVHASFTGNVGGSGTVRGRVDGDDVRIEANVASLTGTLNEHQLGGGGAFSYDGDALQLRRVRVRVSDNLLQVDGVAGERLALTASAELPEIATLIPDAAGALTVSMELKGSRDNPEIRLDGLGNGLAWSEFSTEQLEFGATGRLDSHTLRADVTTAHGTLGLVARGGLKESEWSGEIDHLTIRQPLAGEWRLGETSGLALSAERVTLTPLCLQRVAQEGQICAMLESVAGAVSFDVGISKLPLAAIPVTLPQDVTVAGYAEVTAAGSYANERLSAELALNLQDARVDAVVDDEPVAAVLEHAEGRATITDNALQAAIILDLDDDLGLSSLELSTADVLDTSSAVKGEGNLAIDDLTLLAIFVPDIANPRGDVRGKVAIGGTLVEPEFTGDLAVSDAAFDVRRAGIEIRDINIQLAQAAPGKLRFSGRAASGDGYLAIEGDTLVSTSTGVRSEIRMQGQDFELLRLPDWRVAASPDIVAVFDDRVTRISGELLVPSANIEIREIPQTAVSPSPDVVVHRADERAPAARRRVEVDVRAGLGDDVRIAAFGLTTGITGEVQLLGGSHEAFKGFGRLTLLGGRYKAYGQDLDIERGELIFNGALDNPQLDVRAIRRTSDVIAGIQLSGTPTQLRSSVFSEPALSEAEALSYLLTGRPLASASETGDGDMLNSAAFALGVSSAGSIVSEIRAGLGLETLAIEGGPEDGRLIAGKRIGDRLLVEYGYGLVDNLGTLLLRYRLSDRFTLESRTGAVSNFDIVYSVKKK